MKDMEYLTKKRTEILEKIKPICEAFGITNYDYLIKETGQTETLVINNTKIGCSSNSVSAVVDELIGYLFIQRWCKNRHLGTFSTQSQNVVTRYWITED